MDPKTVRKYSHQTLSVIIYSLPSSKKDFLKLEHCIELLLRL